MERAEIPSGNGTVSTGHGKSKRQVTVSEEESASDGVYAVESEMQEHSGRLPVVSKRNIWIQKAEFM